VDIAQSGFKSLAAPKHNGSFKFGVVAIALGMMTIMDGNISTVRYCELPQNENSHLTKHGREAIMPKHLLSPVSHRQVVIGFIKQVQGVKRSTQKARPCNTTLGGLRCLI